MGSNTDSLNDFFVKVIDGLVQDASQKQQSIPVASLRHETDDTRGNLYAADYFKYLIYGRGPGKAPPPDKILEWVSRNPETQAWRDIEKQSLAYVIGQKIAKQGTDIYEGKKQGIDLLGVMEKNMPELLASIAKNEVIKIATSLRNAVK